MTRQTATRTARRALPAAFAALALSLTAFSATAQEERPPRVENGARFGAWTVVCEAIAVNETLCVLTQRLVASEGQSFLTELLAFNDADEPQAYLAARVPLGVHFPGGFSFQRSEEGAALEFEWQSCTAQVCEALLVLDAASLAQVETDDGVLAGYVPAPGAAPLVFRIGTEGLGAGLEALAGAMGQPGIAAAAD